MSSSRDSPPRTVVKDFAEPDNDVKDLTTPVGHGSAVCEKEAGVEQAVEMIDGRPRDIYDKFTKRQKETIVAIVSFSAFLAPVASSSFLPSIPIMASDLHSSATVINYTVAIYLVTIGAAPVFWSPLSGFYGRRGVYLASMPLMVFGSLGVSLSHSIGALIGTRILQGFGCACVLAVGAGTVGDIYRPTERANAMSWFYSGILLGPALSPVIAGIFTEYTAATWRTTQYFLLGTGVLSVLLTFLFLPETSHGPLPHDVLRKETGKRFVVFYFNPLRSLLLFRWPNICLITLSSSCLMLETYCVLVPLTTIFEGRYGITNVAVSGCLYLSSGAGNIVGSRIAGPWADRMVKQYIAKRGFRRPEDRLRAALLGVGIVLPGSCIAYGWLLQSGAGGIAPPLVMLFINGVGVMLSLAPLNTYCVDTMQTRSAEVIAVNNFIRYVFAAASSAFVLPLTNAVGVGWTNTIAAFISWIALGSVLLTLRYGHIWREKANTKYGMTTKEADEEKVDGGEVETKDEEARIIAEDVRPTTTEEEGDHEGDEPGHLVSPPSTRKVGKGVTTKPSLSRQNTREMPQLGSMLERQVSLSGASVHGGG